jgi:hypothetical protein
VEWHQIHKTRGKEFSTTLLGLLMLLHEVVVHIKPGVRGIPSHLYNNAFKLNERVRGAAIINIHVLGPRGTVN